LSAEIMSCGPYGDAAELPAVLDALGAEEPVVDEVAPADELGVTAAGGVESGDFGAADPDAVAVLEVAAAEVAAVEVAAMEVAEAEVEADGAEDAPSSSPLARA
jgi:hypothetical protein